MIITAEISLYPLREDFDTYILKFIKNLRKIEGLSVYTTAMSTLVKGEMDLVFDSIKSELMQIYDKVDTSSTIIKIVNRPLPIEDGYYKF